MAAPPAITIDSFPDYNKDVSIGAGNPASCFDDSDIRHCSLEESTETTRGLEKNWDDTGVILVYVDPKSHLKQHPRKIEKLGEGTHGVVYKVTFELAGKTANVLVKVPKIGDEDELRDTSKLSFYKKVEYGPALERLKTASGLRKCDLVRFKFFSVTKDEIPRLFTVMDQLDVDCNELTWNGIRNTPSEQKKFGEFLYSVLSCLVAKPGHWYSDMKLANCGSKVCDGTRKYFLIDVDAIDDEICTYPIVGDWAVITERDPEQLKRKAQLSMVYAFAVTAVLFCKPSKDSSGRSEYSKFYWENVKSLKDQDVVDDVEGRLVYLETGLKQYPDVIQNLVKVAVDSVRRWLQSTRPKRSANHTETPPRLSKRAKEG
jgi:hypothetical protein